MRQGVTPANFLMRVSRGFHVTGTLPESHVNHKDKRQGVTLANFLMRVSCGFHVTGTLPEPHANHKDNPEVHLTFFLGRLCTSRKRGRVNTEKMLSFRAKKKRLSGHQKNVDFKGQPFFRAPSQSQTSKKLFFLILQPKTHFFYPNTCNFTKR